VDVLARAPEPVLGRRVRVEVPSGTVLVRRAGSRRFTRLTGESAIPTGSEIDATNGSVELTSALDGAGHTQSAVFRGGRFEVRQSARGRGMVDLFMRGALPGCTPAGARPVAMMAARRQRRRRSLWSHDSGGKYRTHGAGSVATVRGTTWVTVERCDGTVTKVREGVVAVRDLAARHTVVVHAGHKYLSRIAG
jgi:hypothetical protein